MFPLSTNSTVSIYNGTIIHLIDHYLDGERYVHPNYSDYHVKLGIKTIGTIRRMFGGTKDEYWIILSPRGSTRVYKGRLGAKVACSKLAQLHTPGEVEKITTW